ncbi:MAG TPA: LytR C-terminal domain-containing protein [Patescibacteria group bacterium]|nr:LytR C-terminal domain-containing protein [Patescibacteria group bacterium]
MMNIKDMKPMQIAKVVIAIVIELVLFAGVAGATIFALRMKPELAGLSKGQAQVQAEVDQLVSSVGKLMTLPSDEKPTIATVTDPSKLKEQAFFQNAKAGDRVLIYTNARKAILYRPTENKIIEVGAININQQAQATQSAQPVKFAIYNGTTTPRLTDKMATALKTAVNNADVDTQANAKKNDYSETILIDLSGKSADVTKQLADLLKIKVGTLPAGEKKPTDDLFLIIVGKDLESSASPAPSATP